MSILSRVKSKTLEIKDVLFPQMEFDSSTLPWIDQPNADIASFLEKHPPRFEVNYDMAQKLEDWRSNGYAVLEQAIPHELLDKYWKNVEDLLDYPEKHDLSIRIDLPKFEPNQSRSINDFPKEDLKGKFVKINDFHSSSINGKKLMAHPSIVAFLETIFNQQTVVMQSLTFLYGSQQPTHQDFPWVTAKIPSHLAAAWIAVEDIHIDSGPLYYYIGSHKIPKFNFGNGMLFKKGSTKTPLEYASYLDETCKNYPKETLLIKKGDVLIWHGALAHGGSIINNPEQTRKSFICHYSTVDALPFHRANPFVVPVKQEYNGMVIYNNPEYPHTEDSIKE